MGRGEVGWAAMRRCCTGTPHVVYCVRVRLYLARVSEKNLTRSRPKHYSLFDGAQSKVKYGRYPLPLVYSLFYDLKKPSRTSKLFFGVVLYSRV